MCAFRCDTQANCADGSDEANCPWDDEDYYAQSESGEIRVRDLVGDADSSSRLDFDLRDKKPSTRHR